MNCDRFQLFVDKFVAAELSTQEQQLCEIHISECEDCLVLWSSKLKGKLNESDESQNRFAPTVLSRLGVNVCEQSESLLCEYNDSELENSQQSHLQQHLNSCNECSTLLSTLTLVEAELNELAEIQPAREFADQVLVQTMPGLVLEELKPSFFERITGVSFQALAQQLMIRPRFPIEAAFAATVVWTGFFGVPMANSFNAEAATLPLVDRQIVQQRIAGIQSDVNDGMYRVPKLVNEQFINLTSAGRSVLANGKKVTESHGTEFRETLSNWLSTTILNSPVDGQADETGETL